MITSPARRARLTNWIDMMLSPPSAKKLSSIPTRSSPRTSANSPHRISSCGVRATRRTDPTRASGAGSARRSSLPLGVSGRRSSTTNADGTMCSGRLRAQMRTQRRRIGNRSPRRYHIANQPLATGAVLARNHRRLRNIPMAHQRRLDLPRLDAEAPHLHLRIRTTQKLQHPINAPARQVPGAVHPAPRRTKRVRNKPLRRQTRAPHIAPRKASTRDVKLSAHTSRTGSRPPSRT